MRWRRPCPHLVEAILVGSLNSLLFFLGVLLLRRALLRRRSAACRRFWQLAHGDSSATPPGARSATLARPLRHRRTRSGQRRQPARGDGEGCGGPCRPARVGAHLRRRRARRPQRMERDCTPERLSLGLHGVRTRDAGRCIGHCGRRLIDVLRGAETRVYYSQIVQKQSCVWCRVCARRARCARVTSHKASPCAKKNH